MPIATSPSAEIDVVLRDHWGEGGVFDLTLTALDPLSGWTLTFDYSGEIANIWNARILSLSGDRYSVENVSYNASVAEGQNISFGFEGAGGATMITPVAINGDAFAGVDLDEPPASYQPEDHQDMAEGDQTHHDHMSQTHGGGDYIDITAFGVHHGTSSHTHHDSLDGGRTPITTEALVAYNALRNFLGFESTDLETIGDWAFANQMTNNSQGWGGDVPGVGLYYAMQGAKVAWIRDDAFDPQILADIQREARLRDPAVVLEMTKAYGHEGFAAFLEQHDLFDTFLKTLKMEPHYGGWMHGRTHGGMGFPDEAGGAYATAHDVNHLTVLSHDQMQPFMNDTFDWPQWPALDVPHEDVINYFQAMATLGDPLGDEIPIDASADPITPEPVQDDGRDADDHIPDDHNDGGADNDHDDGDEDQHTELFGDGGANRLIGDGADNIIFGRRGDDTLAGRAGEDAIMGGGGDDMLRGGADEDLLSGGLGDDTLRGGGDEDTLKGGAGQDRLVGGGDEDVLIAGKDRDVLIGGGGEDRFVFAANHGMNIIRDFEVGEDELRIRGADSLDQLTIRSIGDALFIDFQATTIKLNGVEQRDLSEGDFVF